jgi:hypothetical protein
MEATVLIIAMTGLVFPILLILAAVLLDLIVLAWASFRWWRDDAMPVAMSFLHRHLSDPIVRYAHVHGVGLRHR